MRLQAVGTVETVVSKRDEDGETRRGKLASRLRQLEHATAQGFTLTHTAVPRSQHSDDQFATFVDTLTQDRSVR